MHGGSAVLQLSGVTAVDLAASASCIKGAGTRTSDGSSTGIGMRPTHNSGSVGCVPEAGLESTR
jgi:hypothetical protein